MSVELTVGEIQEVNDHPNADKLIVLRVNLGSETRQLVAGLKGRYEPKELVDTKVIVVSNLKPANLRGQESQGMLLASEDENGFGLVRPEAEVGTIITEQADQITIEEFFENEFTSTPQGLHLNGDTLDIDFSVDGDHYGKVR